MSNTAVSAEPNRKAGKTACSDGELRRYVPAIRAALCAARHAVSLLRRKADTRALRETFAWQAADAAIVRRR